MLKKIIITLIVILTIILGIFFGVMIQENNKIEEQQIVKISEKITDECTNEYEQATHELTEEANSTKEKISPNCQMNLIKNYLSCGHKIVESVELPQELVNMTKEELQEEYEEWNVEEFSENKITLLKDIEGNCGEHYILKSVDEKIVVYQINEDGTETEYLKTEISTEYLTETDKINIKLGLEVQGIEDLNMILEDFE